VPPSPEAPERAFSYAVLRVVPRVDRGERVNVGVVLHAREHRFLSARVAPDGALLAALAPGFDLGPVRAHLDALVRIAAGDPDAGPLARLDPSERFHWIAAPSSTVIQPSEVHTGLCGDPQAELDHLFATLVARDLPAVELAAGDLRARFVPRAGMVGASLTHRGEELLGQRHGLRAYADTGKTFGLPLLHPWANRLGGRDVLGVTLDPDRMPIGTDERGQPNHGLTPAALAWQLDHAGPDRLRATLPFTRDEQLAAFPRPHALQLDVALTPAELRVATTLLPLGEEPVPVAFGWHPYLTLPGVPRDAWHVELPVTARVVVDDRQIPTGASEPATPVAGRLGDAAYDDGYDAFTSDAPVFALEGGGRRLELAFTGGYTHAQVFAPPGTPLIAFEPMTAPADALRSGRGLRHVAPGGRFTASFAIRVRG
jgi:galactose mutarotase-like enzyme